MAEPEKVTAEEMLGTTSNDDRISSLPDSLICHILSFLPTITSVTTTILSRRWRHLCKDLQVFYFDQYAYPRVRHFEAFVNTVLEKRRFRHIRKFHLSSDVEEHDSSDMWIRAAIGPLLQELHLCLRICSEHFDFPHGVFTCTSLVSLSLEGDIDLCDLPSVHLPSLKYLKLEIAGLGSIDVILSGCPVLETLVLYFYLIETPAIHMPHSLKSLTFVEVSGYAPMFKDSIFEDLEIDTPYLEYLYITTWNCVHNLDLVSNFPNMVEAHLEICLDRKHISLVVKLLKALCRTKLLVLLHSTMEGLLDVPFLDLPKFCCLLHLQLELPYFDYKFLINLLHNCPMLQVLKIDNQAYGSSSDPSFERWTQATGVPNCVISELGIFKLTTYAVSGNERAFVAYILQRGLVLKTMTICTFAHAYASRSQREENSKELSILPRASNICQLEVDGIKL